MAVLKLRTDGTVDEVGAASSSSAAAEAPTQATMATMMVTPETLTGTGGGETSEAGVSAVAVKETIELPPVMLSLVNLSPRSCASKPLRSKLVPSESSECSHPGASKRTAGQQALEKTPERSQVLPNCHELVSSLARPEDPWQHQGHHQSNPVEVVLQNLSNDD